MDTHEAYAELGLDPSASDAQLKVAWRRLVAAWHPDRNWASDAVTRMQRINKAYRHIRQLRESDGDDTAEGNDEAAEGAEADTTQPQAQTAHKIHLRKVRLSLEDAILGTTRTLRGRLKHRCDACLGMGQRVLAKACATCRGSGAVRTAALFGWFWNEESCTDCGGDGRQRGPCDSCDGGGEISVNYRRRVRFPAGLRSGHVLTVPTTRHGELEIGLELQVEIEPHPLFTLSDDGVLSCEMPVNGYAWMAQRSISVPTPDGLRELPLKRTELVYRLSGQGFPMEPRGPRGDFVLTLVPWFPALDNAEQQALLEQLITRTTRFAEADATQPQGQWKRRMKRWKAKQPTRDS